MTTIPAGWKLVPIEPTRKMWDAVNKLDDEMAAGAYDGKGASIEQIWACLVDAAPSCLTCNDQGAVGNILNAEPCPDCTAPASPLSTVEQGDAQNEHATVNLQPVAAAFFTEKGEVAYTGIYDRTLRALEAVKTTRMGISAGSIDLYTRIPAPAAGDARDAARYRALRRKVCIVDGQFHILNLAPTYVAPDSAIELDHAIDAAIAAQRQGDA